MPFPSTRENKIVDRVLSNIAHGYRNGKFVFDLAFPQANVDQREGRIIRFNEDELYLHDLLRTQGSNTLRLSGDWGSESYDLYEDAVEEELPIEQIKDTEFLPINLQRRCINRAMYRVQMAKESKQSALLQVFNNYLPTNRLALSGSTRWSDPSSNPEEQFDNAHTAILNACGMYANVGIASIEGFNALKRHPVIRDKFKYVRAGVVTKELVASVLGLKVLEISTAKYKQLNNPAAGRTSFFSNQFWMGYNPMYDDDNMMEIGKALPSINSDIDKPSFGYTYTLKDSLMAEEPYYERNNKTWYFPVSATRRPVLTGLGAGYLFTNVT